MILQKEMKIILLKSMIYIQRTHLLAPRMKRRGYGSLLNVTAEAEKRLDMGKRMHLISKSMYRRLQPFVDVLGSFKQRADFVDANVKERASKGHHFSLFGGLPDEMRRKRVQVMGNRRIVEILPASFQNRGVDSRLTWSAAQFKDRSARAHGARFRARTSVHSSGPHELEFRSAF